MSAAPAELPARNANDIRRIALTRQSDAEITFRFHDSSLDPYVRVFVPKLSPYTAAVASGNPDLILPGQTLRM